MAGMSGQIANAVQQQSTATEEIAKSVHVIREMSDDNMQAINASDDSGLVVQHASQRMQSLAMQFWQQQLSSIKQGTTLLFTSEQTGSAVF